MFSPEFLHKGGCTKSRAWLAARGQKKLAQANMRSDQQINHMTGEIDRMRDHEQALRLKMKEDAAGYQQHQGKKEKELRVRSRLRTF